MSIILDGTTGVTFPNGVTMADGTSSPVTAAQGGTGLSSVGTAGNTLFTTDGSTWSSTAKIVRGSAVTLTTQTSVDFTSIPSWVKRITIMFNGVSTNGTSEVQIQVGSGSIVNTNYKSYGGVAGGTTKMNITTGFIFNDATGAAAQIRYGTMTLTNISGNIWVESLQGSFFDTNGFGLVGGGTSPTLSGVLDRVRITTVNGTDQFDAGSVNILYE